MQIETSINGDKAVVTVTGKLTVATSPELEAAIQQVDATDTVSSYDIDLTGLEYISSAGLRVLLATQKAMQGKGEMIVTGVNDIVMEVFEVTGFCDILNIAK